MHRARSLRDRTLTNFGGKVDIGYAKGAHNIKFGGSVSATKLAENFSFGLTDPAENFALRVAGNGNPVGDPSLVATTECSAAGSDGERRTFAPGLVLGL